MKRQIISFLILILLNSGCVKSVSQDQKVDVPAIEYTINGTTSAIFNDLLVASSMEGLKVIDLATKKEVTTIPIPKGWVVGFDIYGDTIVWSDFRNEEKDIDDFHQANADIFAYNLQTSELKQPNSDIFIYDLRTNKERRLTGDEVQLAPEISSKWVAFTLSRQVDPKIEVVRYK